MADLANLQFKIKNGMKIHPSEMRTMIVTLDDKGVVSRRKWTGFREYPDSQIDLPGLTERP